MDASHLTDSDFAPGAPPPDGCCCWPLWNGMMAAGQRGLAVVLAEQAEGLCFWLQSRGVDFKHEQSVRANSDAPQDLYINLVTSQVIHFCPWCGRRLEEVAAVAPVPLARFAAAHRAFVPDSL